MNYFCNRKDSSPKDTIRIIKKILRKNGVKTKITNTNQFDSNINSVRLELIGFKGIGTNGKGYSKEYAIASAYAEFMERLQTGYLLKSTYMNKIEFHPYRFNRTVLNSSDFFYTYSCYLSRLLKNYGEQPRESVLKYINANEEFRSVSNFIDLQNDKEIHLPIVLINMIAQSNGLCAGNSFEEAVVQGICEVMERFCYREILFKKLSMPRIVTNDEICLKIINPLKKMGLVCEILDCSLGGRFPVVGLLASTTDRKKYRFAIGSDPDFLIALQRCVSEMLQGFNKNNFIDVLIPIENDYYKNEKIYGEDFLQSNWLKCYSSNSGVHPYEIFTSTKTVEINDLPFFKNKTSKINNQSCLKFLKKLCKKNNYQIFIKDYSILGFPTYRVFIPGMSEIDLFSLLNSTNSDINTKAKNTYYDIYSLSDNKCFSLCMDSMRKSIRYFGVISPAQFFHLNNMSNAPYFKMDYFDLYLSSLLILGNYKKAKDVLNEQICRNDITVNEKQHYEILLNRLTNKSSKKEKNDSIDMFLYNTKEYLSKLKAPSCPNCKLCVSSYQCSIKYKNWYKIQTLLFESAKQFWEN